MKTQDELDTINLRKWAIEQSIVFLDGNENTPDDLVAAAKKLEDYVIGSS